MNKKNEKKSATHRYIPVFSVLLFPPEILLAIYRRRKTADEKKACRSLTGFLLFFSCFFFLSLSLSLSLFCVSCVSDHLYLSPLPLCCSVSLSCRTPSSLRTPTHTHTHPLCALLCTTLDLGAREYVPTNQPTNQPTKKATMLKKVRPKVKRRNTDPFLLVPSAAAPQPTHPKSAVTDVKNEASAS